MAGQKNMEARHTISEDRIGDMKKTEQKRRAM